jgi:hypothetical protein
MPRPSATGDAAITDYANLLKRQHRFPLKPGQAWRHRSEACPLTSYLLLPHDGNDAGTRPLPGQADDSAAIEVLDAASGAVVPAPRLGGQYRLRCRVRNLGGVGCYSGIAEFYAAAASRLDALAAGTGDRPPPIGYGNVSVAPDGEAWVACQRPWTFGADGSALLARAYDFLVDTPLPGYDARADRRVARRDFELLDQETGLEWQGAAANVMPVNQASQSVIPRLPALTAVEIGLLTGNPGHGSDVLTLEVLGPQDVVLFTGAAQVPDPFDGYLRFPVRPSLKVTPGARYLVRVHDSGKCVFHWKYALGRVPTAYFARHDFGANAFLLRTYGKA